MCLNENVCESVFYFKPKDEHKKLKCLIKLIENNNPPQICIHITHAVGKIYAQLCTVCM